MQDVWDAYSKALYRLRRYGDSLAALKKGAELSPASAAYFFTGIANLCLLLDRPEEAGFTRRSPSPGETRRSRDPGPSRPRAG